MGGELAEKFPLSLIRVAALFVHDVCVCMCMHVCVCVGGGGGGVNCYVKLLNYH